MYNIQIILNKHIKFGCLNNKLKPQLIDYN